MAGYSNSYSNSYDDYAGGEPADGYSDTYSDTYESGGTGGTLQATASGASVSSGSAAALVLQRGTSPPNTLLTQTNLSGALATIQDDPDSPDAVWMTKGGQATTVLRVGFPTPGGDLVVPQEFRVRLRP